MSGPWRAAAERRPDRRTLGHAVAPTQRTRNRPAGSQNEGGIDTERLKAVNPEDFSRREAPARTAGGMTMAHIDTWADGSNATYLDFIYNVTYAVGPLGTAPNRPDDVLLVQYFLKNIVRARFWEPPTLSKPFPVNGRMGPDTAAWIWDYQLFKRARCCILDGRIDRALGVTTSSTHTWYTIVHLNYDFEYACHMRDGSSDRYNALEDDNEAPPELRRAIKLSRERGSAGLPWDSPGRPKGG
jgi:hypothetical protein